jgi:hypothetical protein
MQGVSGARTLYKLVSRSGAENAVDTPQRSQRLCEKPVANVVLKIEGSVLVIGKEKPPFG